jgi:simple sugar transport system ATP-binding protein
VSVLRRGALVAHHVVAHTGARQLATEMVGGADDARREFTAPERAARERGAVRLAVEGLSVEGDRGQTAVDALSLQVHGGEIVGGAGVAGNGQRELVEALVGQRSRSAGQVRVGGEAFHGTRAQNRRLKVRSLPEEPLRNACVGDMSVADNLGLRRFDVAPASRLFWLRAGRLRERARALIAEFGVKTRSERAPMRTLSGGNVQRAVLARELSDAADVLIVANPVFGLDFAAVAEIHQRLMAVRNGGGAVLLVSEDLDELFALADRLAVMHQGQLTPARPTGEWTLAQVGLAMSGQRVAEPVMEAA